MFLGVFLQALPVEERVPYRHKTHVRKLNMKCSECHTQYEKNERAGMPAASICIDCHNKKEEHKKLLKGYFTKEGEYIERKLGPRVPILVHHKRHAIDEKISCKKCHKKVKANKDIFKLKRSTHKSCFKCHENRKNDCNLCHQTSFGVAMMPKGHHRNFMKLHGQLANDGSEDLAESKCMQCHVQSSCTQCHQQQPPQNHTHFWRQTGHGKFLKIDREQCSTCHQSSSCTQCHQETRPRTHRGNFGGRTNTHCISCHLDDNDSSCATCHRVMPSHLGSSPMPGNPAHLQATSEDCRTCHLPFKTHIDNGDDCRLCHK
jgi:hypothetical protein